jgi:hypothetical protein
MHTMKKTTRHEAGNDGRLARMLALCALWLAAGTTQAQILVTVEDTTHRVKEPPGALGQITNVRIVPGDDKQATIRFDADWTGSRRNDLNHDAAWIFFKVRPEGAKEWQHIRLAADRELNPKGYACEGNRKMDLLVPNGEDGYTGMFVRQAGQSSPCSIALTNVTAVWNLDRTGIGRDTKVQIVAVCLKMVYIAEGPFYLGSGGTEPAGWYQYPEPKKERAATFGSTNGIAAIVVHEGVDDAAEFPAYLVKNAGPIPTGKKPGLLWARGAEPEEGEIPATFPNGYRAFYVMKDPINPSDYVTFLNTVPAQVADELYDKEGGYFTGSYWTYEEGKPHPKVVSREGTGPDYTYVQTMSTHGVVARGWTSGMRWLSWERGAPFAAWAGLRPFTELEFEKYMRGPRQPVPDEAHHSFWGLQTRMRRAPWPRERPVTAAKTDGWDPKTFKGTHGLGTTELPKDWPQKDAVGVGFRGGWCLFLTTDNLGDPGFYRTSARGKMTFVEPDPGVTYSFRGARTAPVEAAQFSEEE